ncbi:MAG: hypothetical protein M3Q58_17295 [Bacteroidota bacterium]|nr:hypothetical protein [Bacteroidota bacterium]
MHYDVFLYLGRAYHLSYIFNDGITALNEYKKRAKAEEIKKNNVAGLLENCKNGQIFMSEQISMEVENRTNIEKGNLLSAYNPGLVNDWLMYKITFFVSPLDKKKKEKLLMCKAGAKEMIQVSYGINEQAGKDLYYNSLLDGNYGQSKSLGIEINTPFDEDYPYVTKDGKTLYFSSKGHNSMGGFDIFKSTRDSSSGPWSKPVNMGYPINSPYDDILFIVDTLGDFASFSSNRKNGNFENIQIKTLKTQQNETSIIKGHFTTLDSIESRDAIITVFYSDNDEIAGIYKTKSKIGTYIIALPSATKYSMIIESEGYPELNAVFSIPEKSEDFILSQEIRLRKEGLFNVVKVNNYFTEEQASKIPDNYAVPK